MITDYCGPEIRPDLPATDLSASACALAERIGLMASVPGEIVIIAADDGVVLARSLRAAGSRACVRLGDLQLGGLLERAGAGWATWCPYDFSSGRVEAELRAAAATPAEGHGPGGRS